MLPEHIMFAEMESICVPSTLMWITSVCVGVVEWLFIRRKGRDEYFRNKFSVGLITIWKGNFISIKYEISGKYVKI